MKKMLFYFAAVCFVFFLIFGCTYTAPPESDSGKVKIVTTFLPLYSFTVNVAQEKADVFNLVPPGSSIHAWEPAPSDIKKISEADLLVKNGLHLETFLERIIKSADNPELRIIDTSKGIDTYSIDHDHHGHQGVDPHIWLSTDNAVTQISNIVSALTGLDPKNADYYQDNAKAYIAEITTLKNEITSDFLGVKSKKPFIVFHDAYQYFLREFGLLDLQVSAIEPFPGKEPSPSYLHALTKLIQEKNVQIVFTEPQFSSKIVAVLQDEYDILTYELDPIGQDVSADVYLNNMRAIKDTFLTAFHD